MRKQIIKEYFEAYRLRNIAAKCKEGIRGIAGVLILVSVIWSGDKPESYFVSFFMFFPLFLILASVFLHPVRPGKLFYLCPMDESERACYIRESFFFSQGMSVIYVLLGNAVLAMAGYAGGGLLTVLLCNGIAASLCLYPVEKRTGRDWEAEKQNILGWFGFFVAFFSDLMIMIALTNRSAEDRTLFLIAAVLVAVFCEIPVLITKCRFLKGQFQRMENYERSAL